MLIRLFCLLRSKKQKITPTPPPPPTSITSQILFHLWFIMTFCHLRGHFFTLSLPNLPSKREYCCLLSLMRKAFASADVYKGINRQCIQCHNQQALFEGRQVCVCTLDMVLNHNQSNAFLRSKVLILHTFIKLYEVN